jgi:hypothetical protein
LKPIKTPNSEKCIDNLLNRVQFLLSCLNRDYDLEDHEKIELSCSETCNIPIEFSAHIGNGANCWITGDKSNGESLNVQGHYDKAQLLDFLENIRLPKTFIIERLSKILC